MKKTIRIDASGRVVIPQGIREKYGLVNGSHRLEVVESPEGIVLRPLPEDAPATRHRSGWIVFHSADPDTVDSAEVIGEERERRHRSVSGDE